MIDWESEVIEAETIERKIDPALVNTLYTDDDVELHIWDRVYEDVPQNSTEAWLRTAAPANTEWPAATVYEMDRINNLLAATGTAPIPDLITFTKEVMKNMKAKATRDYYLTPNWVIPKGSIFRPSDLSSVTNITNNWNQAKYWNSFVCILISYRKAKYNKGDYLKSLENRGRATFELPESYRIEIFNEDIFAALTPYFAAIDWWLLTVNNKKLTKVRFGTIGTLFMSMSAYRDFSYGETIGTVRNPIWGYVLMNSIREDLKSMCRVPKGAHGIGSIYPYMSALGIVFKTDMSANAKPDMHNFVNATACLMGAPRGMNSKHMEHGDITFLINSAFAAYYRFGDINALKITGQANKDEFIAHTRQRDVPPLCTPVQAINRARLDHYDEVREWLLRKGKTLVNTREGTIGRFIFDNCDIPSFRSGKTITPPPSGPNTGPPPPPQSGPSTAPQPPPPGPPQPPPLPPHREQALRKAMVSMVDATNKRKRPEDSVSDISDDGEDEELPDKEPKLSSAPTGYNLKSLKIRR